MFRLAVRPCSRAVALRSNLALGNIRKNYNVPQRSFALRDKIRIAAPVVTVTVIIGGLCFVVYKLSNVIIYAALVGVAAVTLRWGFNQLVFRGFFGSPKSLGAWDPESVKRVPKATWLQKIFARGAGWLAAKHQQEFQNMNVRAYRKAVDEVVKSDVVKKYVGGSITPQSLKFIDIDKVEEELHGKFMFDVVGEKGRGTVNVKYSIHADELYNEENETIDDDDEEEEEEEDDSKGEKKKKKKQQKQQKKKVITVEGEVNKPRRRPEKLLELVLHIPGERPINLIDPSASPNVSYSSYSYTSYTETHNGRTTSYSSSSQSSNSGSSRPTSKPGVIDVAFEEVPKSKVEDRRKK